MKEHQLSELLLKQEEDFAQLEIEKYKLQTEQQVFEQRSEFLEQKNLQWLENNNAKHIMQLQTKCDRHAQRIQFARENQELRDEIAAQTPSRVRQGTRRTRRNRNPTPRATPTRRRRAPIVVPIIPPPENQQQWLDPIISDPETEQEWREAQDDLWVTIDPLPPLLYNTVYYEDVAEDTYNQDICPVCHDDFHDDHVVAVLACGHILCTDCAEHINNLVTPRCPLCNYEEQ
jgi:hypothetical protein